MLRWPQTRTNDCRMRSNGKGRGRGRPTRRRLPSKQIGRCPGVMYKQPTSSTGRSDHGRSANFERRTTSWNSARRDGVGSMPQTTTLTDLGSNSASNAARAPPERGACSTATAPTAPSSGSIPTPCLMCKAPTPHAGERSRPPQRPLYHGATELRDARRTPTAPATGVPTHSQGCMRARCGHVGRVDPSRRVRSRQVAAGEKARRGSAAKAHGEASTPACPQRAKVARDLTQILRERGRHFQRLAQRGRRGVRSPTPDRQALPLNEERRGECVARADGIGSIAGDWPRRADRLRGVLQLQIARAALDLLAPAPPSVDPPMYARKRG
jgi:hypothetical protein